jgi:hypothetical protein
MKEKIIKEEYIIEDSDVFVDDRIVSNAKMINLVIPMVPDGHGNPNVWRIRLSATFRKYDQFGKIIGEAMSTDEEGNKKVPYLTLLDNIPNDTPPNEEDIIKALEINFENLRLWKYLMEWKLTGKTPKGYVVFKNKEGISIRKIKKEG